MTYFVGVSGFSYPSWRGKFYPKELKSEEFLGHYSRQLGSVEINSSFYAFPSATTVKGWAEKTRDDFSFAFKAPRQITHVMKLGEGSGEASQRLWDVLEPLGARRGPVLFQLPPFAKQDTKLLDRFLTETDGIEGRVFEFRHGSWFNDSTYRSLEKGGAGLCVAETEDMKPVFKTTGGLAYFRLRLESYEARDVDAWARKIREVAAGSRKCYVYLRHDETGENAILARRLSEKLSG